MKKQVSLMLPILWTMCSAWWIYRFFTNLPVILEEPVWMIAMDTVALIGHLALAVTYWILYVKGKREKAKGQQQHNGKER